MRFYIYASVTAPVSARVISNNCWVCSASPLRLVSRCFSVLLEVFVRRNKSSIWWWGALGNRGATVYSKHTAKTETHSGKVMISVSVPLCLSRQVLFCLSLCPLSCTSLSVKCCVLWGHKCYINYISKTSNKQGCSKHINPQE